MRLATLKRRLRVYGLSRRGLEVGDHELREIVRREICGPGETRQDGNYELSGSGLKAHKYGSSPSNQRIECWWSFNFSDMAGLHGRLIYLKIWSIVDYWI